MSRLNFQVESECPGTRGRTATFHTLHGEVKTPIFMPVGTNATVRAQSVDSLRNAGSRVLLANTFHLMLRPGPEVFQKFGGIHRFMNWDGPVLTDSGGFQIFSLPKLRDMTEEGARFQSYLDGETILLSPEKSISVQRAINSDIMMVLDQCIPSTAGHAEAKLAMERTHRWALRSLAARGDSPQSMFGIVQGACFEDLRHQSAEVLTEMPFDGFAIGGLAVGETKNQRDDFTELTAAKLPRNLPRYLMGVGTPLDLLEAVHRGVDMFDCIMPSQLAQRGAAYTSMGRIQLRRGTYKFSEEPLDPECECRACRQYSRAYLHHLYKAGEVLGWKLLTHHNLIFYHRLMQRIREHLTVGTFPAFYRTAREALARNDEPSPNSTPPKPQKPKRRGDYEIHQSPQGFCSVRQVSSGEVMHSVSDPTEEAKALYVDQSHLAARLKAMVEGSEPLCIWDVGLGAATNAMAAVRCFEAIAKDHPNARLNLVSFERDLDPLHLALKHSGRFPHLYHRGPASLLDHGSWEGSEGRLKWTLLEGDFLERLDQAPPPDLIFFDPFSFKTDSGLWTEAVFQRIHSCTAGRSVALYTYSASTAVRAALLAAGFLVARGVATGPKSETTIAFTRESMPEAWEPGTDAWLGDSWLSRWERSHAKFPAALSEADQPQFETRIRSHRQFQAPADLH